MLDGLKCIAMGVVIAKMRLVGAVLGLHESNQPRLPPPPDRLSILTELRTCCKTKASACNTKTVVLIVKLPRAF
jgi:hypothetical protein